SRMRRATTPRPTLEELHRAAPWWWVICDQCLHSTAVALVPFIIRWGPGTSSDVLRRSARCTKCGCKGAALQHPVGPALMWALSHSGPGGRRGAPVGAADARGVDVRALRLGEIAHDDHAGGQLDAELLEERCYVCAGVDLPCVHGSPPPLSMWAQRLCLR